MIRLKIKRLKNSINSIHISLLTVWIPLNLVDTILVKFKFSKIVRIQNDQIEKKILNSKLIHNTKWITKFNLTEWIDTVCVKIEI